MIKPMHVATRSWLGLLCCCAVASRADAAIYAFTDAAGGTHYSNVPSDPRYTLLLADPEPASSAATGGGWRARAATYAELIDATAQHLAVQPALLRAVIATESAFEPQAVSRKGAQGLMQLLPATARRYGVHSPFDPAENIAGGARYLRDLLRRYGNDLKLALAAYNAGEDAVDRYGGRIPPFPETQQYVPTVLKWYQRFRAEAAVDGYSATLPPPT